MTLKKLVKPKKRKMKEAYDFHEVMYYLEKKHGKRFRDYASKYSKPDGSEGDIEHLDWWHWFLDQTDVHNGCYVNMPKEPISPRNAHWVNEINQYWLDFLGDDYFEELWLEW